MDDPLSAVDAHVGRHIFDNAICGLLQDKCRILATHQPTCSQTDVIGLSRMEDGKIETIDTFANLINHNANFQKMMASTAQEVKQDDEVNEDDGEEDKKDAKKRKVSKRGAALMQQEERAVRSVPLEHLRRIYQSIWDHTERASDHFPPDLFPRC